MATCEQALHLADAGFFVFPLIENSKLPLIENWQHRATRDPDQIRRWWLDPVMGWDQGHNIGICTTRYGDNEALVVVDVDNKNGKRGDDEILSLELAGCDLPRTWTQGTPTGGRHLVYRAAEPVRQGANVLGDGLDIRSRGGFIVAVGSEVESGPYTVLVEGPLGEAPAWLIERCGKAKETAPATPGPTANIDRAAALSRAQQYLENEAPAATEGGRNHAGFLVAARLKDLGVAEADCFGLMLEHWDCQPMLDAEELQHVIHSAFKYGRDPIGVAAPEAQFPVADTTPANGEDPKGHPLVELNRQYAFVIAGGGHHIIWETRNARGVAEIQHLSEATFHKRLLARTIVVGKRTEQLTDAWMRSPKRRSYDGLCFMPGEVAPPNFYNLWRGFTVAPAETGDHPAVEMFKEHALQNVCNGDPALYRWLMGYLAHMIQRPHEKPLTALVFRGGKGVGKNSIIERVGHLLGEHFMVTSNRRYLVSNFNGHMERMLCFVLDEAFWSGDKASEGILKDLITGQQHTIEHKGAGVFTVDNRTRVVIIGNEDWLAPASHDERRFAVFSVGDGRKQDRDFFLNMRLGMEAGGYSHLLRFFLDFDLTGIDVNQAPVTDALLDQKHASLEPIQQWWLDCLSEGRIEGGDFSEPWPEEVEKSRLRDALHRYLKARNVRVRFPDERSIGKQFKKFAPSVESIRPMRNREYVHLYKLPALDVARGDWTKFVGQRVDWD